MPDHDELLQQALDAIDEGVSVDEVIGQLPAESEELASLIRLATAVRGLDHPTPRSQTAKVLQASLLPEPRRNGSPAIVPALNGISGFFQKLRLSRSFVPVFGGAALLLVVGIVTLSALALIGFTGPRRAHAATLVDASGLVEVAPAGEPDRWTPVQSGDRLSRGQRLRTGPGSEVTLVYYEGSRTTVGPLSDITLARLDYSWGKVFQVNLIQEAGRTNSSVLPLQNKKSEFSIRTPSGTAQVQGTVFNVLVGDTGRTRFAVEDGQVEVITDEAAISLNAGQAVAVVPGEKAPAPDNLFSLQGFLTVGEGSTWFVSGVPFTVLPETFIPPAVESGLQVQVDGRVLANGDWVADYLNLLREGETLSEFTGVVQDMDSALWQIGDWSVAVDAGTEVGEGVTVGALVKVVFGVAEDGQWRAASIQLMESPEEAPESASTASPVGSPTIPTQTSTPTSTSTPTPPPTSIPTQADTPAPTLTPTAAPTPSVTPEEGGETAPQTSCTGAQIHPTGDELARRFGVPYEEIMGWFCQGFGFGEIEQAYTLSLASGTPVDQIFAMRQSGMGWGEIKRQLEGKPSSTPAPADGEGGEKDKGKGPPQPTEKPEKTKKPKN